MKWTSNQQDQGGKCMDILSVAVNMSIQHKTKTLFEDGGVLM